MSLRTWLRGRGLKRNDGFHRLRETTPCRPSAAGGGGRASPEVPQRTHAWLLADTQEAGETLGPGHSFPRLFDGTVTQRFYTPVQRQRGFCQLGPLRPRRSSPRPGWSEPAAAWALAAAGLRPSAGNQKPTAKVETGTDRVPGCLGGEGLYPLWLLFITHKSFAFY